MRAGAVAPNNAPRFRRLPRPEGTTATAARLTPTRQQVSTWVFLLPALAFFAGYQVYPIFRVLWISFTDFQYLASEPAKWVGFDNYIEAFNDPLMWAGLWRAALFTLMFLPGTIILPLLLGDSRQPGDESGPGDLLPCGAAHSGGDSKHARVRAVEVDVQLSGRARSITSSLMLPACSPCKMRRSGWVERR